VLIKEAFELDYPKAWTSNKVLPVQNPDPSLLQGLELEIEAASFEWEIAGMEAKEDGSLRNNGVEFVLRPMTYSHVQYVLTSFFQRAGLHTDNDVNYSERTSIHVHTNCLDLTIEQVTSILMLYQVFEDLLFEWVGNDRKDNIFCVPWSQTQLTHGALNSLESFVNMASVDRNKYTAVNIVPLKSLGTIEWRHMAGTCNVIRIMQWLRFIGHFYRIVRNNSLETIRDRVVNLNTTSEYEAIVNWLFNEDAPQLKFPGFREHLEEGVLNMKYSINKIKPSKRKGLVFDDVLARDIRITSEAEGIYAELATRNIQVDGNFIQYRPNTTGATFNWEEPPVTTGTGTGVPF